jgi:hypothetical protein
MFCLDLVKALRHSFAMKKHPAILTALLICLGLVSATAQPGGPPSGPRFDGALGKLFGETSAFTATLDSQITPKSGDPITMPGKIIFDSGKASFEMNLSGAKGLKIPADAAAQMKSMGLDQITTISLPEKKLLYLIYPGLQSYVVNTMPDAVASTNENFKVVTTQIGKETVDGHACVENKVVITDEKGEVKEFTVWNATDLKNFPVKIFHAEDSNQITLSFKNISLVKPAAAAFIPPASYTRYDDMQTMMQTEMMKKMAGGMTMPH